ncbi:hypothetical protein TNCV_922601 [Trichonephila clavipes]|nr:hypothetical protein TNCV_922601 [Trichonephila clavipes]
MDATSMTDLGKTKYGSSVTDLGQTKYGCRITKDNRKQSKKGEHSADKKSFSRSISMSKLAFFAHANFFHRDGHPVPVELSVATIPEEGKDPEVVCVMVDHSSLLTTPKDDPANRYTNEILHLKTTLLGFVPLEHLAFCFRASFATWPRANGASSWKGTDQQKIFFGSGDLYDKSAIVAPFP